MAERPVANASPLILLARAGLLDFLKLAGPEIVVPSAVADEIRREGENDPAVRALQSTPWLKVVEAPPPPAVVQGWDLGAGESAVLTWAHAHAGTLAIVDDLAARRCAAALRIPVRGTLGLVLIAIQRGQIKAARPVLESMRAGHVPVRWRHEPGSGARRRIGRTSVPVEGRPRERRRAVPARSNRRSLPRQRTRQLDEPDELGA